MDRKLTSSSSSSSSSSGSTSSGRRLESIYSDDLAAIEDYFGKPMERKLKSMPTTAVHSPSPWPGRPWPVFQDNINF